MDTSIIINSTDTTTGKKYARSVTNINPDATDEQCLTLAQGLNGLTGSTLTGATRINKSVLYTAGGDSGGGGGRDPGPIGPIDPGYPD